MGGEPGRVAAMTPEINRVEVSVDVYPGILTRTIRLTADQNIATSELGMPLPELRTEDDIEIEFDYLFRNP
jgi:hypothetical protein